MTAGDLEGVEGQPWYHGKVTRVRSEALVKENGDFLVRDSISQPGEYVLTAFWKKPIHFQINAATDRSGHKLYHFEDEEFSSVPDLLSFYCTHRRPVTLGTGCLLKKGVPINDSDPINLNAQEHEAQYARIFRPGGPSHETSHSLNRQALVNWASRCSLGTSTSTLTLSASRPSVFTPPLPNSLLRAPLPIPKRSPPASKDAPDEDYCDIDYDTMEPLDPVAPARSLFNADIGASLHGYNYPDCAPLRAAQSCDDLVVSWRDSPPSTSSPSTPSPSSSISPHSSSLSPSPPSSSSTSTDSGNGISDRENSCLKECEGKAEERDSGCVLPPDDDDYDIPRDSKPTSPHLMSAYTKQGSLRSVASSLSSCPPLPSSRTSSVVSSRTDADDDYSIPRNSPLKSALRNPLSPRTSMAEPPKVPPKPVIERIATISQVSVQRLRHFVMDRPEMELAVLLGHEDAAILGVFLPDHSMSGVGSLLISTGISRREQLRLRCRLVQLSVLVCVLGSSSGLEASRLLSKWIGVTALTLKRHGNHFAFINLMRALSAEMLNLPSLWQRVEFHAKEEFKQLGKAYSIITRQGGSPSDSVTCSLPFVQPLLDIFDPSAATTGDALESCYIDRSSPSCELEWTFRWLEAARSWTHESEAMLSRCYSHYSHGPSLLGRAGIDNQLSNAALSSTLFGGGPSAGQLGPVMAFLHGRTKEIFGK